MNPFREPIGWPLLPLPDDTGRMGWPSLDRAIRDTIEVILSTRPGEQLMRPRFGGGLTAFLDQPDTLQTRRQVRDRVTEALSAWENRISVELVDVSSDGQGAVRVVITWRARRTGAAHTTSLSLQIARS